MRGLEERVTRVRPDPVIVTLSQTPDLARDLDGALRAAGITARVVSDESAAAGADLVVLDHRALTEADLERLLTAHAARTVLVTAQEDKDNINNLLARFPICHLIGANGRSFLREIVITVRKQATGDIWGLAKYFDAPVHLETKVIDKAEKIDPTIEDMLSRLDLTATFSATHEFLRLTTNELTTNAVYNAPVDAANKPKYEQTDRKEKIHLLTSETVEVSVCHDATFIGVSVADQFGRLDRDKIVRHLVKCVNNTKFIENKKGGAGAGIYLAFYTASQFIINIDPGKRLEAICILERSKRYKEYRSRITSFNYFTKLGGAA